VTSNGLTLKWSASANAVGYTVYQNGVAVATVAGTTTSIVGLTDSTTYSFTVAANNAANVASGQSVAASATTLAVPAPVKPGTPTFTAATSTLSWAKVTNATSYIIYNNGVQLTTVAAPAVSAVLNLPVNAVYSLTVAASNKTGTSAQSTAAKGMSLTAPTASQAGANTLTVSWSPVAGASSYTLQRNSGGGWATVGGNQTLTGGKVNMTVNNLTSGATYTFRVVVAAAGFTTTNSPVSSGVKAQ
jgi:hypothetical protein